MVTYSIGVLQLIKLLKQEYPDVTQPWYSDDDGALGMFNNIGLYFNQLKQFGLGRGYYPKPLKIVLLVYPDNTASNKQFGLNHGFKVCTGARYLGGFIGDDKSKCDWLKDRTFNWEKNIHLLMIIYVY